MSVTGVLFLLLGGCAFLSAVVALIIIAVHTARGYPEPAPDRYLLILLAGAAACVWMMGILPS